MFRQLALAVLQRVLALLLEFLAICAVYGIYVQSLDDVFGDAMSPTQADPHVSGANWWLVPLTLVSLLPVQYFVPWVFELAQSYRSLCVAPPAAPSRPCCKVGDSGKQSSTVAPQSTKYQAVAPEGEAAEIAASQQPTWPLSFTQWRYLRITNVFAGQLVRRGLPWTQEDTLREQTRKRPSYCPSTQQGHRAKAMGRSKVAPLPTKVGESKTDPAEEKEEKKQEKEEENI